MDFFKYLFGLSIPAPVTACRPTSTTWVSNWVLTDVYRLSVNWPDTCGKLHLNTPWWLIINLSQQAIRASLSLSVYQHETQLSALLPGLRLGFNSIHPHSRSIDQRD
jgi:hypothetical protein